MSKPKRMTLGNMRELGVQRLIASCLNDACRHAALIDAWSYPAETEIQAESASSQTGSAAGHSPFPRRTLRYLQGFRGRFQPPIERSGRWSLHADTSSPRCYRARPWQ